MQACLARQIDEEAFKWDPNEQPELANHWIETSLGLDHGMLRRVFDLFTHCQAGGPPSSRVRKGGFLKLLNDLKSFRNVQLCAEAFSPHATSPKCGAMSFFISLAMSQKC